MSQPQFDRSTEPVEAQLERLLAEAENRVARLRAELESARSRQLDDTGSAAQHAEIDRLQEHLSRAEVHWSEVLEFFEAAIRELLGTRGEPDDTEEP